MRGKIVLGLFILTLVSLFCAVRYRGFRDHQQTLAKASALRPRAPASAAQAVAGLAASAGPTEPGLSPAPAPIDPQFQKWISEEAKSLDEFSVNGDQKQVEIREVMGKITADQARQLGRTVLHPQSAAREKVLSAYLLVEGGISTREELKNAITAPLIQKGGETHSEEEIDGVREKSLRIMMIDGLFTQAQKDPKARETLARAIADSGDPYIKAYAQEKYDQLSK